MGHAKNHPIQVGTLKLGEPKEQPNLLRSMAMATYDLIRPVTRSAGRAYSPLTSLFSAFATWNDVRKTRKELSQLSLHELSDIGLTRGDIDHIAAGGRI